MESLLADFRYATHQLAKRAASASVALLIISLGVGANGAIFSVVNAVLLKPLPVESPDALAEIYSVEEGDSLPGTAELPACNSGQQRGHGHGDRGRGIMAAGDDTEQGVQPHNDRYTLTTRDRHG